MSKVTLLDILSGYNSTTKINQNNVALRAAIENTLSRDGTGPNAMLAPLDMNSFRVLNLGSPTSGTDAARWADVTSAVAVSTPLPSQTGNAGKVISTNGSTLFWDNHTIVAVVGAESSVTVVDASFSVGDVRRYGLVPNAPGSAASNGTILRTWLGPNSAYVGPVVFPNTTGIDIWYIQGCVPLHDKLYFNLNGSTLNFTQPSPSAADTNTGCLHAMRDFVIQNGTIVVNVASMAPATSAYSAIFVGARGDDCPSFTGSWDSLLPSRFGKIRITNMNFQTNVAGGDNVQALGGVDGMIIENCRFDGGGVAQAGFQYEFGWATNQTNTWDRQTSHCRNVIIRNCSFSNYDQTSGSSSCAVVVTGGYGVLIDNIWISNCSNGVGMTTGESLFYNRWMGQDDVGGKRAIWLNNVVVQNASNSGISVTGAQLPTGYLSNLAVPLLPYQQVDLLEVRITGGALGALSPTTSGRGISSSAGMLYVDGVRIGGFLRGIELGSECTLFRITGNKITNCGQSGILVGSGANAVSPGEFRIFSPARLGTGLIGYNFVAGNSVSNPGTFAGISITSTQKCIIEGNRLGYETIHDGFAETTQAEGIHVSSATAPTLGVVCRDNHVGGTARGDGFVYYNEYTTPANPTNGVTMTGGTGLTTQRGAWGNLLTSTIGVVADGNKTLVVGTHERNQRWGTTFTSNHTVTLDTASATQGASWHIIRTGLGAFTLNVGGLKTIPASTAATVDVMYDAGAWVLTGYSLL